MFNNFAFAAQFSMTPIEHVAQQNGLDLTNSYEYAQAQSILDMHNATVRQKQEEDERRRLDRIRILSLNPQPENNPIHNILEAERANYGHIMLEPVVYGSIR